MRLKKSYILNTIKSIKEDSLSLQSAILKKERTEVIYCNKLQGFGSKWQ